MSFVIATICQYVRHTSLELILSIANTIVVNAAEQSAHAQDCRLIKIYYLIKSSNQVLPMPLSQRAAARSLKWSLLTPCLQAHFKSTKTLEDVFPARLENGFLVWTSPRRRRLEGTRTPGGSSISCILIGIHLINELVALPHHWKPPGATGNRRFKRVRPRWPRVRIARFCRYRRAFEFFADAQGQEQDTREKVVLSQQWTLWILLALS